VWESVAEWFEAANIRCHVIVTKKGGEISEVVRGVDLSLYDGMYV